MTRKLYRMSAWAIVDSLVKGDVEPEEYVASIYERIRKIEPKVNAYITLRSEEEVVEDVRKRVTEARSGKRLPLAGVLVAVKDNISTSDMPTTCASRMLSNYIPPYNATVVDKLIEAGAVIIGKTNMDEFAMGSTGETSYYGPTRNPWSIERVPGGSSSGTAAALAAGMATLGLGSDTGGSIRLPAAWTGLVGLKPTYGLVSRYGLIAYAESLEQIGPMARSIDDLALLLSVIAGYDEKDSTSLNPQPEPTVYIEALKRLDANIRAAIMVDLVEHPSVDKRIARLVWKAAETLSEHDIVVGEVRLGRELIDYALPAYYIIALAEASSNLARYDGVRYGYGIEPDPWESWNSFYSRVRGEGFGREVRKRIMLGSWILSAGYRDQYYIRALRVRRRISDSLSIVFKEYDVLLGPSAIEPPPRLGEAISDPVKLYLLDLANVIANLAGVPALVQPIDNVDGIPIGVQLIGPPLSEKTLIAVAKIMQETTAMRDLVAETI